MLRTAMATRAPARSASSNSFSAASNSSRDAREATAVAAGDGREIPPSEQATLVQEIHKDQVRWCGILMRTIKSFLNRGQAWVVRKLQALIPRIQEAHVRSELAAMLEAHHHNIGLVDARPLAGAGASSKAKARRTNAPG